MLAEHRQMERFSLELPIRIQENQPVEEPGFDGLQSITKDVCAGGAFVYTDQPFPIGTEVHVDLTLVNKFDSLFHSSNPRISLKGKIVRTSEEGMAIQFSKQYKMHNYLS